MEEYLSGTQFELELAKACQKLIPKYMKEYLNNPELEYEDYGTEAEKKLKLILRFYVNISVVLRDIDLTLKFLGKDRTAILEDYRFLCSQETYFKYHCENYFIRIITILDIIGKLGTLIYGFDLDLDKVSAYIFKDKVRKDGYDNIARIIDKLINKLAKIKAERHKKLHTGEADIKPFNGIPIWEDLNAIISSDTDDILKQYTDQKIKEEIDILTRSTIELIEIVKEFLEESNSKLNEIITTANSA